MSVVPLYSRSGENERELVAARSRRATRLPESWALPEEWLQWAVTVYGLERKRVARIGLDFYDYWIAKAGANATKMDWFATWRRWIRKEVGDA